MSPGACGTASPNIRPLNLRLDLLAPALCKHRLRHCLQSRQLLKDTHPRLSSSASYDAHMFSSPDTQAFLKSSELTLKSQGVLRQLLERFEHLDLTGKLSTKDPIIQKAHGGYGDVYVVHVWIRRKKIKCALKRLRFYIYKDKDFARVCLLACSILR